MKNLLPAAVVAAVPIACVCGCIRVQQSTNPVSPATPVETKRHADAVDTLEILPVTEAAVASFKTAAREGYAVSVAPVFPAQQWQKISPESAGVDPDVLGQALSSFESRCGADGIREMMVIRYGYVIHEGPDCGNVHDTWSMTKSVTSSVFGVLLDQKKCTPQSLAKDFVPSLSQNYPEVTLHHFATMTCGYTSAEAMEPLNVGPPAFAPGEYFHYDESYNQFANILSHIAGKSMADLFTETIGGPIGIDPSKWQWNDLGTSDGIVINGGSGTHEAAIHTSADQIARLGLLFLNKGRWNGGQVLSEEYVESALTPQVPNTLPCFKPEMWYNNLPGSYGYGFWVNGTRPEGTPQWENAPPKTALMQGFMNNVCFIFPEWDMVVVRMGQDTEVFPDVYEEFFALMDQAVVERTSTGVRAYGY
jgi:CubicO group peptidase (beta-lactamase class C family)